MKIAYCLFDGMTALDFIGAYDPLTRLGRITDIGMQSDLCATSANVSTDGLGVEVDHVDPDLGGYDLIFVPGGTATRTLRHDRDWIEWLQTAHSCDYLTSVCTGSLLLGAAGFLEGKTATTHPSAFDLLDEYATVTDERVVQDGRIITGRGVSSSIDLGLYLVELLAGHQARVDIANEMDYPYGAADGDIGS